MDTSCSSPRQQQQHHPHHHHHQHPTTAAVVIIDRSPARNQASPAAVCKLTPSQEQQRATVVDTQGQVSNAGYTVCTRCGQISHDLDKCDFCSREILPSDKTKPRLCGPKRRLNLDGGTTTGGGSGSGAGSQQPQPSEAKMSKRTFYGNNMLARPLLQTVGNNVLTVRQPAVTNGQARPVLSAAAAMQPAKPCLTISISSDEEADAEATGEECHERTSETPTKENHPDPQPATAEIQCLARVQDTPPESPRGGGRSSAVLVTSTHPEVPRSFVGSNPPAPSGSEMRFSCRSIRVGSYKVPPGEYWVTVSNRGLTFTIQAPTESHEVLLHVLDSDVVQVLGNLSRNMAVLFVTTNNDSAAILRTKLGMNRKSPGSYYYDPMGRVSNHVFFAKAKATTKSRAARTSIGCLAHMTKMAASDWPGRLAWRACHHSEKVSLLRWCVFPNVVRFAMPERAKKFHSTHHFGRLRKTRRGRKPNGAAAAWQERSPASPDNAVVTADASPSVHNMDSGRMSHEKQKRITFLPEPPFSEDQKIFLRQVFPGPLLHEIKQFEANEILIRSSPGPPRASEAAAVTSAAPSTTTQPQASSTATVTHLVIHNVPSSATIVTRATRSSSSASSGVVAVSGSGSVVATCEQGSSQEEISSGPNIKLLVYPAPPKTGGIPVHSADLRCLREGQFLNDVIIDFYLKYLLLERLSEEVRQRTHIFSSFFYPRLTQRLHPRAAGQQGLLYLLLERLSEEVRQRTHIFSSFFYPRLTQRLHPRAAGQQGLL
ncbi:hypothetical protein HPB50_015653 [Hyalomma asiaticum]|uniref:Uncharacterized protein n=1 Tax=Hyalomma asiaticum TaxID=266040 RepID=A0ACB7S0D7_HYAAI|nr:hypothetical protein HPB50_015653 [Hyalomma asiaticum]